MSSQDLQQLGERLAAAEQELAAARAALVAARDVSGGRHDRHRRRLAAMLASAAIAFAVVPAWRASAQGPSATDAQLLDLSRRVEALENVKTENLSERIRKVSDRVTELENVKTENLSNRIRKISDRLDDLDSQIHGITEELVKDIANVNH